MRRKKTGIPGKKRIVSVCSASSHSGVTLTAAALACAYAERSSVTFAEAGKPYVFDAFGLAKKFLLSGFTDFFRDYRDGKPFCGAENFWHGVHWAVHPGSAGHVNLLEDGDEIVRFAQRLPGEYSVLDCSGLSGVLLEDVLSGSDRIVLVVDPLPGKLLPDSAKLQRLRYAFPRAVLAVNRVNRGVHRKELDRFLGTTEYLCLPNLDAETIYKAQYACVLPWDLAEGKKMSAALEYMV